MTETITITSKGQIHIPVGIRAALGLESPGLAEIKLVKKTIWIKLKASPLLKLAGKYRNKKISGRINLEKIRDKIDYSGL